MKANARRNKPGLFLAATLLSLTALVLAGAPATGTAWAWVEYDPDPDAVVVSLIETMATPRAESRVEMEIHGDGLVVVHYPESMKRAGTHTLKLEAAELHALLAGLVDRGLATFDQEAVLRSRDRWIERTQHGTKAAPLSFSSDRSTVQIGLHFEQALTGDANTPTGRIDQTIHWTGLQSDRRAYDQIGEIQNLAAAVDHLRKLRQRTDLIRVD